MPIYLVTATDGSGTTRAFEYTSERAVKAGDYIRETEPHVAHQAIRVRDDPDGRYDGLIDADWRSGPAILDYRP